jgi:dihydrolipoamide dehydrogenase
MKDYGVIVDKPHVDWNQMQLMKNKAVTGLTSGIEGLFKKNKIEYLLGWGSFKDSNTIKVDKAEGGAEEVSAKNIIIATGSVPTEVPGGVLPFDEKRILSSTDALSLPEIPKEMVVLGAGVIGLELGSVYKRLGTKVTIIEFLDRITPTADFETA